MKWTSEEVAMLRNAYAQAIDNKSLKLDIVAKKLGRDKANVCRKARDLGLTNISRPKEAQRTLLENQPKYATKEERAIATGQRVRLHLKVHGHPKGAAGMKHTEDAKQRISEQSRMSWADPNSKRNQASYRQKLSDNLIARVANGGMRTGYTRTRGGKRADLGGVYFRSAWEANYARYLNLLKAKNEIADWHYECKTFVFEAIKRGTRAYTPDFKVINKDGSHEWHEVKGWMDDKSKTRLDRMARYFPKERIVVVGEEWFRAANRGALPGVIKEWEGVKRK
jgi:Protein of unknown function (DUF1064)